MYTDRTPTFISFDADHDEGIKELLIGQAKNPNSPFEIIDWSVKEPFKDNWKEKVRGRIRRVKVMIVMCGLQTHKATGVSAEIEIAREERVPYFLLQGYADKHCTKPKAALPSDKMYEWTWANLVHLINGRR